MVNPDYTSILRKVRRDFDIMAEHFSEKRRYVWEDIRPFLKLIKNKDRVLDIGCGNGRLYQELKKKNIDYLGIDFSKNLLKIARRKYPEVKFKLADITRDKTWKELKNFDVCFCIGVLHHIPGEKLALKILKNGCKALKNKGYLFVAAWNIGQEKHKDYFKNKKQKEVTIPYKISDGKKVTKTVHRYIYAFEKKDIEKLIKKAGFKILDSYYSKRGKKTDKKSGHNLCFVAQK